MEGIEGCIDVRLAVCVLDVVAKVDATESKVAHQLLRANVLPWHATIWADTLEGVNAGAGLIDPFLGFALRCFASGCNRFCLGIVLADLAAVLVGVDPFAFVLNDFKAAHLPRFTLARPSGIDLLHGAASFGVARLQCAQELVAACDTDLGL